MALGPSHRGLVPPFSPLPDAVWSAWRNKLLEPVRGHIPTWQAYARLDPVTGSANQSAVSVMLSRLLIAAFERQPAEAVAFLPVVDNGQAIPVRVTQLAVDQGKLTMHVQPLTTPERAALLERIRR